jgi:hypothetical protein
VTDGKPRAPAWATTLSMTSLSTYRRLMRLLSVNVGRPRPNPWKPVALTGIDKRPVSGPVMVTAPGPKGTGAVGLAGDRAYDVQSHGGPGQAVYAYARISRVTSIAGGHNWLLARGTEPPIMALLALSGHRPPGRPDGGIALIGSPHTDRYAGALGHAHIDARSPTARQGGCSTRKRRRIPAIPLRRGL